MSTITTPPLPYASTSTNQVKKSALIGTLIENGKNLEILGFIAYWNIRDISVTRDQFLEALTAANINTKYAKEHNARSSLIRALATLKEKKIVRITHEDEIFVTFQFTAEVKTGSGNGSVMEYHPQVVITVDKAKYVAQRNKNPNAFRDSINNVTDITTKEEHADSGVIKDQLALSFDREMTSYTAHDLTRYIQNIFTDQADIVSLRQQGSIYFVPAIYKPIVDGIKIVVTMLGGVGSRFDAIPMPDTKDTRKTVGDSFAEEVAGVLANMNTEITELNASGKNITENWVEFRRKTLQKIRQRINMYDSVLGDKAAEMFGTIDDLNQILQPRLLEI